MVLSISSITSSHPRAVRVALIILAVVLISTIGISLFVWRERSAALVRSHALFEYGHTEAAIAQADLILAEDPDNVSALLMKATALAQQGSTSFQEETYGQQAIDIALQVLAVQPRNDEAWRIIGYSNEIMEKYDDAHAAYAKALEINGRNALAISQDAHAWDLQGELAKAEAGYARALELEPDLAQARVGMARVLAATGRSSEALAHFKWAYVHAPNVRTRAEAAFSAGVIERVTNHNLDNAESYMYTASVIDPTYSQAWVGLGSVLFDKAIDTSSSLTPAERTDFAQQSIAYIGRGLTHNPAYAQGHLQLALELAALGQKEKAVAIMANIKDVISNDITLNAVDKERLNDQAAALLSLLKK